MATASAPIQRRGFSASDDNRSAGRAGAAELTLEGLPCARITGQPGWRWSTDVKPIAGTDSC